MAPGMIPVQQVQDPYSEDSSMLRWHLVSLLLEREGFTIESPAELVEWGEAAMKFVLSPAIKEKDATPETSRPSGAYL